MHDCAWQNVAKPTKSLKVIYSLSSTDKFQIVEKPAKYTVMKTKNVNFITPMVGVMELGCGHIFDIVKMLHFITIFYSSPGHRADS